MARQKKPKLSKHAERLIDTIRVYSPRKRPELERAVQELKDYIAQLEYDFAHYENQPEPLEDET